jgi:hypothetical protein
MRMIQDSLLPTVRLDCGYAPRDHDEFIRHFLLPATASDLSQQDASHSEVTALLLYYVLMRLGFPTELVAEYFEWRSDRAFSGLSFPMRGRLVYKLASGEPMTLLGNTIMSMAVSAHHYALPRGTPSIWKGDDALISGVHHPPATASAYVRNLGVTVKTAFPAFAPDFAGRVHLPTRSFPAPERLIAKHSARTLAPETILAIHQAHVDQDFNPDYTERLHLAAHLQRVAPLAPGDALVILDFLVAINDLGFFLGSIAPELQPDPTSLDTRIAMLPCRVLADDRNGDCAAAALAALTGLAPPVVRASLHELTPTHVRRPYATWYPAVVAFAHKHRVLITRRPTDSFRGIVRLGDHLIAVTPLPTPTK